MFRIEFTWVAKMCVLLFKGRSHFLDTITTPFHFLYISHFPFFVGQPHMLLLPQIHPCQCVLRTIKFMGLTIYVLVSVIWQCKREYLDIVMYQSKQCDDKMSHKPWKYFWFITSNDALYLCKETFPWSNIRIVFIYSNL